MANDDIDGQVKNKETDKDGGNDKSKENDKDGDDEPFNISFYQIPGFWSVIAGIIFISLYYYNKDKVDVLGQKTNEWLPFGVAGVSLIVLGILSFAYQKLYNV